MKKQTMLRASGAAAALAALSLVAVGGAGAAGGNAGAATITMERDGKELFFDGPRTVEPGAKLKVENLTNPRTIGPHTFSLVKKGALPNTTNEIKNCGRKLKGICGEIIDWHEVDLDTGEVGRPKVDVGDKGWDTLGNERREGDSQVTEEKGETFSRQVTAKDGSKLFYICAVHPEMQGKIKVEG